MESESVNKRHFPELMPGISNVDKVYASQFSFLATTRSIAQDDYWRIKLYKYLVQKYGFSDALFVF